MRLSAIILMMFFIPLLAGCGTLLVGSAVVGTAKVATKVAVAPVVLAGKATKAIITSGKDDEKEE